MASRDRSDDGLLKKLEGLPADDLVEVEHFVDFLRQRRNGGSLVQSFARLSEDAFGEVWDNPDDAAYDRL